MERNNRRQNMGKPITVITIIIFSAFVFCAVIMAIKICNDSTKTDSNPNNNDSTIAMRSVSYQQEQTNEYRLPKDLIPFYYDLKIFTSFHALTQPNNFNGTVEIKFNCKSNTDRIVLNANNLIINDQSIIIKALNENIRFYISNVTNDQNKKLLNIKLTDYLKANHNYSVYIEYQGFLLDDNSGFYQASYIDKDNNQRFEIHCKECYFIFFFCFIDGFFHRICSLCMQVKHSHALMSRG